MLKIGAAGPVARRVRRWELILRRASDRELAAWIDTAREDDPQDDRCFCSLMSHGEAIAAALAGVPYAIGHGTRTFRGRPEGHYLHFDSASEPGRTIRIADDAIDARRASAELWEMPAFVKRLNGPDIGRPFPMLRAGMLASAFSLIREHFLAADGDPREMRQFQRSLCTGAGDLDAQPGGPFDRPAWLIFADWCEERAACSPFLLQVLKDWAREEEDFESPRRFFSR